MLTSAGILSGIIVTFSTSNFHRRQINFQFSGSGWPICLPAAGTRQAIFYFAIVIIHFSQSSSSSDHQSIKPGLTRSTIGSSLAYCTTIVIDHHLTLGRLSSPSGTISRLASGCHSSSPAATHRITTSPPPPDITGSASIFLRPPNFFSALSSSPSLPARQVQAFRLLRDIGNITDIPPYHHRTTLPLQCA